MNSWILPVIVALLTPLFAYLGIARRLSGRIVTSEAAQLWAESATLRMEYRQRAEECEAQIRQLRDEIQTCTARNTVLRRENYELRNELKS